MKKSKNTREEPHWTSSDALPNWNQSPVDLDRMYLLHERLPCMYAQGHLSDKLHARMCNTGRTVKVELCGGEKPYLCGGPLGKDTYQFLDMQFRWGPSSARGAEHSIDGSWYTMEAQSTHWNMKYCKVDDCHDKPDGFAILSILFQVGDKGNPNFATVSDNLRRIRFPGRRTDLPQGCLEWMKEIVGDSGYYTYHGSMTTWPYDECVQWIVMPKPVFISESQAEAFRCLQDARGEKIVENFRDKQYVGPGRKIYYATS